MPTYPSSDAVDGFIAHVLSSQGVVSPQYSAGAGRLGVAWGEETARRGRQAGREGPEEDRVDEVKEKVIETVFSR